MASAKAVIRNIATKQGSDLAQTESSAGAVKRILGSLNPVQRKFYDYNGTFTSLRCPRRAGKSYAIVATILAKAEENPGTRYLILCRNLKYARQNFWINSEGGGAAPGGVIDQIAKHRLQCSTNLTSMSWTHANGSVGQISGVEDLEQAEKLRGAPAEVDIVFLDEMAMFNPAVVDQLFNSILLPGLSTRHGRMVVAGTPGKIAAGLWYEASCLESRTQDGKPTCRRWDDDDPARADAEWVLFNWRMQDNVSNPDKSPWDYALKIKKLRGWSDDNPAWVREYLGEWVIDASSLIFNFAEYRSRPNWVTWNAPDLDPELGPWTCVAGLDYGYEDDTAICVLAYSAKLDQVFNLYNVKKPHLLFQQTVALLTEVRDRFGVSVFVADTNQKNMTESFMEMGFSMAYAEKRNKFDYIEKINSDFKEGRIKILRGSELDKELCELTYNLDKGVGATDADRKAYLARLGKLEPTAGQSNHLSDALLYGFRHCYHYFSTARQEAPDGVIAERDADIVEALEAAARRRSAMQNYEQEFRRGTAITQSLRDGELATEHYIQARVRATRKPYEQ